MELKTTNHQPILIPLAEFEYLYDPDSSLEGQIDPNALSAGGFPNTFSWILDEVLGQLDNQKEPENANEFIQSRLIAIREFEKLAKSSKGVGPFPANLITGYYKFLSTYITVMQLDQGNQTEVSDFKVSWEADLGYFCQFKSEASAPQCRYTVWHDLHANTGLFARCPLSLLGRNWSKHTYAAIYQTLRLGKSNQENDAYIIRESGKDFPLLTCKAGKLIIDLSVDRQIIVDDIYTADQLLTPTFNQYGYLYRLLSTSNQKLDSIYMTRALLSSVANAKAAIFTLYEESENDGGAKIQRPPTYISREKTLPTKTLLKLSRDKKIVLKEGGRFSAGGKEVTIVDLSNINTDAIQSPYTTTVVQSFTPSHFFSLNDQPVHGHIRVLAILDSNGQRVTAGFVSKLTLSSQGNSSAFVSIVLLFDGNGNFVAGKRIGTHTEFFTSLEAVGLKPLLTATDWQAYLRRATVNWDLSMRVLNLGFSDTKSTVNRMIDNQFLKRCYYQV